MQDFARDLIRFLKAARHLWGRCPHCQTPFRLSDASISTSPNPPRDWLRRLERQEEALGTQQEELENWESDLDERNRGLDELERELRQRERDVERNARTRAMEMVKDDATIQALVRDQRRSAIQRSRSVLLGKLLEVIAPCFRRFGHDPRDMRAVFDPIDYVLFDGLTVDRDVRRVTFIEVKCGTSRLSPVQGSIREAIQNRRIGWEVWEIGDNRIPIERQLAAARNSRSTASGR